MEAGWCGTGEEVGENATAIGTLQRDTCHRKHQGARDDIRGSEGRGEADKGCRQQQVRTAGSHKTTVVRNIFCYIYNGLNTVTAVLKSILMVIIVALPIVAKKCQKGCDQFN